MTIVDWRQVDGQALAFAFACERARWLVELRWETRDSWEHVERARTTWGLPGLAALDLFGRVVGFAFFQSDGSRCEIGGLHAQTDAAREALFAAVIDVCEAGDDQTLSAFVYADAAHLFDLFGGRAFAVERIDYLALELKDLEGASLAHGGRTADAGPDVEVRGWSMQDMDACAALLGRSYEWAAAQRFVPSPGVEGWRRYLAVMVHHRACGAVMPDAARIAVADGQVIGLALATHLGPATAHLAQVVVAPEWRRRGLAGRLVDDAGRIARAAGHAQMTLMVAASNAGAQQLYRARGFRPTAAFLAATKPLPARPAAQAS